MFDLMIDCETLGVGPFPALLSIGAVVFDPAADTVPQQVGAPGTFFVQVDPVTCIARGASVQTSTLAWWLDEPEARKHVLDSDRMVPIEVALNALIGWVQNYKPKHVWSHGLLADARWLEAYAPRDWPFGYRDARDTRTLFDLAERKLGTDLPKPEAAIPHHPTHDAIAQSLRVQLALRALGL